jgi:tRNA dimethylallyltransferase
MKNILIVLSGPTGVGKTDIALDIAEHFNTEILSSDSRQFYKEMRIGTAVPDDQQLQRIKHHFIRFISVEDYYSASRFEADVLNLLPEIFQKNRFAIMVGGSGMYIDAVCNSIDDIPDVPPEIRQKYIDLIKNEPVESLRVALKLMDPVYYSTVDLKNSKRIIRALEICETTGRPYSSFLTNKKKERDFIILKIGLSRPREELYERINSRVDKMIEEGLLEEVKSLYERKHLNALNSVGYREIFEHLEGNITFEKSIELIKRNTRRFAKRQITWWSRDKEINWFHPDEKTGIIEFINVEALKTE